MRTLIGALLHVILLGCGSSDDGAKGCAAENAAYDPPIVAADFSATITNPLLPFAAGTVLRYAGPQGHVITVTVTSETRVVMGVTTRVVHDVVTTSDGKTVEDTFDWYAQDAAGNVWYFGEDTKAYSSGTSFSTTGSWEAGIDCAKPGIVMEAAPKVGDRYRQEYRAGVAEDEAEVVSVTESVTVPAGSYTGCVKTRDTTRLEPDAKEEKIYCPTIGEVDSVDVGEPGREQLTSITRM